jgi:DNA (cytosine-5)-methyltransferase 1
LTAGFPDAIAFTVSEARAGGGVSYTVASFFSGIGGLDLGFERAGHKIIFQCEISGFCRDVLARHWPHIRRETDVRELAETTIPLADIWVAGFPCQDLSLARMGPRSGLRGKQSGLFYDFMPLVAGHKPRAVILENVHGLLSSHGGRDFTIVLKALDELGYGVAWRVLNSKDFGVPQQRRRVYIVAVYRDQKCAAEILFEPKCGSWDASKNGRSGQKPPSLFQTIIGNPGKGPLVKSIAHCVYAESARHTGTDWSRNYVWYPDGKVRRFTPNEVERVQGFPEDWSLPGAASRLSEDRIDSLRYHAVGNAVTPQVAEWVARRLATTLRKADRQDLRQSMSAARVA